MNFSNYYPGDQYLDIIALDVYGRDFNQAYYDSLVILSKGKPLVLGEVGNPPAPEILTNQPKWAFYVIWASMVRNTQRKEYDILVNSPHVVFKEDPAYLENIVPYRKACGLLPMESLKPAGNKIDFSGRWVFNEDKSVLDNWGAGNLPGTMKITQQENKLTIQKTFTVEYADDRVEDEELTLDGQEYRSEMWNSPQIKTAKWSVQQDTLLIASKVTFNRGGRTMEMTSDENWYLQDRGQMLMIKQSSSSFWGKRNIIMVYDKQRCD